MTHDILSFHQHWQLFQHRFLMENINISIWTRGELVQQTKRVDPAPPHTFSPLLR